MSSNPKKLPRPKGQVVKERLLSPTKLLRLELVFYGTPYWFRYERVGTAWRRRYSGPKLRIVTNLADAESKITSWINAVSLTDREIKKVWAVIEGLYNYVGPEEPKAQELAKRMASFMSKRDTKIRNEFSIKRQRRYEELLAKINRGEKLTNAEAKEYRNIINVLAEDH